MDINTNEKMIDEILSRSVDTIYPSRDVLREKLLSGKQLRIYMGIDPTATYVHIGHSTNYLILERLHDLGHKIVVLVGDFTAMIGDPSDKTSMRVQLTREQVEENLKSFKEQIGHILNFDDQDNPIEFRFNSDWLAKLTFSDAVDLASNFTVQQMIERDAFRKRLSENKPLFVHEFFYPLMQGYDSVALDVDLEIGGTDQTFNMLAGRTLLKRYKDKEKCVMTTTLLVNPKTGEKLMSKSLGTGVALNDSSADMFGKTMALADEGVIQCFIDCTRLSMDEIEEIKHNLEVGANPRDIKLRLAREIVTMYHSAEDATEAEAQWVKQFSQKEKPDQIEELVVADATSWVELLANNGLAASRSEARRLIEQNAVRLNDATVSMDNFIISDGAILQVGKRIYRKLRVAND